MLDRISAQFEARLRAEIAATMGDMVEFFLLTGEVSADNRHHERLEAIYRAMAIASVTAFGARVAAQGKSEWFQLERKDFARTMTELALRYVSLEAMRRRITQVAETTRAQIVAAVARGYADGLGQAGVGAYIRGLVPQISTMRANLIARTETHGAANYGAQEAARQTGLVTKREWISAEDGRTRPDHDAANGQIVGMDEPFRVGGARLMYPGDPDGPADQVINCRCSIGFVVED